MAGLAAAGCAPEKKPAGEGRAPSLVYSPAERLPSDRERASGENVAPPAAQDEVRPPAGRRCRVHLRREAMGVAGQAPYPLTGNNLATDRASIIGTLERVGRDWIVVRGERSTFWVPRDAVLAVEFAE
jgi:hypothetical protein